MAIPLAIALVQVALGIVFLPFYLLGAGNRNVELAQAAMHLRDAECWVALAPCRIADKPLVPLPWAGRVRGADHLPGSPEPEPFLPLPADLTARHVWFLVWLFWFALYLKARENQRKKEFVASDPSALSGPGAASAVGASSVVAPIVGPTTIALADAPMERAPDGSEVRPMLRVKGGSMAHFRLPAGAVSMAVMHRSVEELWHVVAGSGELWRKTGSKEETAALEPGISVSIPVGTSFQFRASTTVEIIAVTMPPWPGDTEATEVSGPWTPAPPDAGRRD